MVNELKELKEIKMLLIVIIILIVMNNIYNIYNKNKIVDHFCSCSGLQKKSCTDPEKLKSLYNKGLLTEYNFPRNENRNTSTTCRRDGPRGAFRRRRLHCDTCSFALESSWPAR